MTNAVNLASAAATGFTMRNRIINGAMQIWQRGTSFTNSTTYTADRFFVNRNGGGTGINVSRSGSAGAYYMKIQRAAGDTGTQNFDLRQNIESLNCADLAGQTVTLSFTAYAGANFTPSTVYLGYGYSTVVDDGINSGTITYVNGLSVALTTTATRYTYTFTVPAGTNTLAFRCYSTPYSGTAGADDSIYLTNIQLEKGSAATPFEFRSYQQELALCMRYYRQRGFGLRGCQIQAATNATVSWENEIVMRASPTIGLLVTSIVRRDPDGSTVTSSSSTILGTYLNNAKGGSVRLSGWSGGNDTRSCHLETECLFENAEL